MSNKLNLTSLEGFLEYAKEANTRSTLAVEDGLKPVHRRILVGMNDDKLYSNKSHSGSAKLVGAILGNYHPHGDASVYDAMIRLNQDFKLRYPLVEVYGNSGSILDPDSYAAMRYTKVRLTPLGELMLENIDKNTVDMVENYNGEMMEPVVLPAAVPNVLINGGMGIGVGVSSSLVPHNLKEVVDGIIAYMDDKRITTEKLMEHIQGPDFPTGGVIVDAFSLPAIYETGKGTIKVRAKYTFATVAGRPHIVITELPYLVSVENKVIKPIKEMVEMEGYSEIYDVQNSSGKHGFELRIILEKDANPHSVLRTLFEKTGLESTIKINQTVMLKDGSFVTLGLRGLISQYLNHQHDVISRAATYDLDKAQKRLHIVEGLIIAVSNIDEVVAIIKGSKDVAHARMSLMAKFILSTDQANAILDMKLSRITSLEVTKLEQEKKNLLLEITRLTKIINSEKERENIIRKTLTSMKEKFGDVRRTKVTENTISEKGERIYLMFDNNKKVFSVSKDEIATLTRGKRGSAVTKNKVVAAVECNTKDSLIVADSLGKAYFFSVEELLGGTVEVEGDVIQVLKQEEKDFVVVVTQKGIIKKTPFVKVRKVTQFTKVKEDDALVGMFFANNTDYIMALGTEGKCANIPVSEVSAFGRLTYGSKGITTEKVIAATLAGAEDLILTLTKDNKAKLTKHSDFNVNTKGSTGSVITEDCDFILNIKTASQITIFGSDGKAMSLPVSNLSIKSRTAQGAKIYNSEIETIISVEKI